MMTFVSLVNPAFQNKIVDFFITVSISSAQLCAQRIVGDQQMFSGGKEGERGGKEAIIWDANRKKKKHKALLYACLWIVVKEKNVLPAANGPKIAA